MYCELWSYTCWCKYKIFVTIKEHQLIWINDSQALLLLLGGVFLLVFIVLWKSNLEMQSSYFIPGFFK